MLGAGHAQALTITLFDSFQFGNSTYRIYTADQLITWSQANSYANNLPGFRLTSINSAGENAAIVSRLTPGMFIDLFSSFRVGPYIGLSCPIAGTCKNTPSNNGWAWLDGTTIASNGYQAWASGQPFQTSNGNVGGSTFIQSVAQFVSNGVVGGGGSVRWHDTRDAANSFQPSTNGQNVR